MNFTFSFSTATANLSSVTKLKTEKNFSIIYGNNFLMFQTPLKLDKFNFIYTELCLIFGG